MNALHPFLKAFTRRRPESPPARFRVIFPDGRGTTFFQHGIQHLDVWIEAWLGPHGWETGEVRKTRPDHGSGTRGVDGSPARWLLAERIG